MVIVASDRRIHVTGRKLGEDLALVRKGTGHGPMQTNGLTSGFECRSRSQPFLILIRDEEVVGSNPATPTRSEALST